MALFFPNVICDFYLKRLILTKLINIYNSWDISYNMFAFTDKTLHLLKTWKEFIHSEFILKLRAYSTAFLE